MILFFVLPCDKLDILDLGLAVRHPQLEAEPPLGSGPRPQLLFLLHLSGRGQGVGAAGVGPQRGEGDLCVAPLLEQQLVPIIEHEEAEGSVEGGGALHHLMTRPFGGGPQHPVLGVHQEARLGKERLLDRIKLLRMRTAS